MLLPPQIKQNCLDEDGSNILFLAWAGVPDVYLCAPIHCRFHSLSPQTFCTFHEGTDRVRLVMGGHLWRQVQYYNKCYFSGLTSCGRVWRKGVGQRGLESAGHWMRDLLVPSFHTTCSVSGSVPAASNFTFFSITFKCLEPHTCIVIALGIWWIRNEFGGTWSYLIGWWEYQWL